MQNSTKFTAHIKLARNKLKKLIKLDVFRSTARLFDYSRNEVRFLTTLYRNKHIFTFALESSWGLESTCWVRVAVTQFTQTTRLMVPSGEWLREESCVASCYTRTSCSTCAMQNNGSNVIGAASEREHADAWLGLQKLSTNYFAVVLFWHRQWRNCFPRQQQQLQLLQLLLSQSGRW